MSFNWDACTLGRFRLKVMSAPPKISDDCASEVCAGALFVRKSCPSVSRAAERSEAPKCASTPKPQDCWFCLRLAKYLYNALCPVGQTGGASLRCNHAELFTNKLLGTKDSRPPPQGVRKNGALIAVFGWICRLLYGLNQSSAATGIA
jgi:hypothetical protein